LHIGAVIALDGCMVSREGRARGSKERERGLKLVCWTGGGGAPSQRHDEERERNE
jgi:hypothetical protein